MPDIMRAAAIHCLVSVASMATAAAEPTVAELMATAKSSGAATRGAAVMALGERGADAAPAIGLLIDLLEDPEYASGTVDLGNKIGADAGWALARIGSWAVAPLVARLKHPRPLARTMAAQVLGSLGDRSATAPLTALLDDPDGEVRHSAVNALGVFGDRAAFEALLAVLEAGSAKANPWDVMLALSACDAERGRGVLLRFARHDDRTLREAAVDSMGQRHDPQMIDALIAALDDPYIHVQGSAALAMRWIVAERGFEPALAAFGKKEAYDQVRSEALKALVEAGHPRSVELAIEALTDSSDEVKSDAVSYLQKHPDVRTLEPLLAVLATGGNNGVRADAAEALGALGDRRATPGLIAALGDVTALVRSDAAAALARLGDPAALPPLIELAAKDADETGRAGAVRALGRFNTEDAVAAVVKSLRSEPSAHVRDAAAWALSGVTDPAAIDALFEALEHDRSGYVRSAASQALAAHDDAAIVSRLRALVGSAPHEVSELARYAILTIEQRAARSGATAAP